MDSKFQTTAPAAAAATVPLTNEEKDIIAQREREAQEATQQAAKKESAKWNEIGAAVRRTKEEALAEAHRAQMEANALKIQLKQKEEEIAAFKIQARTLEEHEKDYRARGEAAGQPPAFIDRVKSTWEGVKEKLTTTTTDVGHKADEAGAATSEKIANIKEGIGAKMERLGESLQAKGHMTKEHGVKERQQALDRKAELEAQAITLKQQKEFGSVPSSTTTISDFVNDAKTSAPTTTTGQFDTKFDSKFDNSSTKATTTSTTTVPQQPTLPLDSGKTSTDFGSTSAQQQTSLNSNDKMKYTFSKDTFGTGHIDMDSQARELQKEQHRHDGVKDKHITV